MIETGQTILVEKPYVFVLRSTLRDERCDFCFQTTDLKKCSKCLYSKYCSLNCQRSAWPLHKFECANLRKIHPKVLPDSAHLLIRLILKLKNEKHEEKKERRFADLMSHSDEIKKDERRMQHFTSLLTVLHSFFEELEIMDDNYMLELFGKICINSFNILDNDMNSVGTGIYLKASILDHSCKPNALAVFKETTIHIRSVSDIPEFDWSLIKISYIDVLNTSHNRRKELEQMYYFTCDCERCTNCENDDLMNSMKCVNSCDGYVPILEETDRDPICSLCKTRAPEQNIKMYQEMVKLSENHIKNVENKNMDYIDVCETILRKQKSVFHERNIRRIKLLDLAMESCINLGRWNTALEYGLLLVSAFSEFYGLYHPLVGLVHFKVLKLIVLNDEWDSRRNEFLKQTIKILLVTHGREHPLFKNLRSYADEQNFEQIESKCNINSLF